MNKISLKLGYWSAMISALTFVIWIISFVGIALTSPLYSWTDLSGYLDFVNSNGQFFQYLAKSFMIVFSISFLILMISIGELVDSERKILAKLGIVFAIIFSLLSSVHYFVQVSSVRWAIEYDNLAAIEHFLQANPTSFLSSVNMLGWTLFLGLATLFLASALTGKKWHKVIRYALIINGISCLLAGVGYLAQIDIITFFFINLGVGGSLLVFTVSFARMVRRSG